MQKLTQLEAQDLIKKAWEFVADNTLGSYRFGRTLWYLLPSTLVESVKSFDKDGTYGFNDFNCCFFYEQDPDIAIAKFYKYFVEDSNN